jgi:hypothetical protein
MATPGRRPKGLAGDRPPTQGRDLRRSGLRVRHGTSTVYRYRREALELLAAMAPTLEQAIEIARGKAFVILDATLLRIDRVGMTGGRDRPYYSGKHKCLSERAGHRRPRRPAG